MLSFSSEEWHHLTAFKAFNKFMKQLKKEVGSVQNQLGDGAILSSDANATAMQYATNVGRVSALKEIIEYSPEEEKDE